MELSICCGVTRSLSQSVVCVRTVVDIIQSVVVLGSWLCPICSSGQLVVFVYSVVLVC